MTRKQSFGNQATFAVELHDACADVYLAGVRVTEFDDRPYMSAFEYALGMTEQRLKKQLNFKAHEALFFGMSVEDAYRTAAGTSGRAFSELRFADWGPITDGYVTFLLPVRDLLYLATADLNASQIHAAEVTPWELISVLIAAREAIAFLPLVPPVSGR